MKILVISDIHMNIDNVTKIYQQNKSQQPELIILPGDNDILDFQQANHYHHYQTYLQNYRQILQILKQFNRPIYSVPGNHDSIIFFKMFNHPDNQTIIQQVDQLHQDYGLINIDDRIVEIESKLCIVGLGGSIDSYYLDDQGQKKVEWTGQPYQNEQMFNSKLDSLGFQIDPDHQYLLLTHIGPHCSKTAVDRNNHTQHDIFMGSYKIQELITNNSNVICNIHGHTHQSQGIDVIEGCKIINPGDAQTGNYAVIQLELDQQYQKWQIIDCKFINVNQ